MLWFVLDMYRSYKPGTADEHRLTFKTRATTFWIQIPCQSQRRAIFSVWVLGLWFLVFELATG
ncbi:MAG TPA: hypothetical protein VFH01_05025, partial [Pyrinomonadaceae bacterium]|nr:hypothetical protein [Pyrinomonadaceae bacterium]